jgi:hypothetical protein
MAFWYLGVRTGFHGRLDIRYQGITSVPGVWEHIRHETSICALIGAWAGQARGGYVHRRLRCVYRVEYSSY